jgi:hypothetical protein
VIISKERKKHKQKQEEIESAKRVLFQPSIEKQC